jgi:23S rRNA (cytosine1962-C5)-methyltransferase
MNENFPSPSADGWQVEFGDLQFLIRPTSFKHTGLFPEQLSNWKWVGDIISRSTKFAPLAPSASDQSLASQNLPPAQFPNVLNLFGYTGGATLAAAKAGASVTHVDASKIAVAWARENATASGLADKPIRWMIEDVLVFVKREIKRGNRYDGIIMDPPAFGHGPKDELWKIEENLRELVRLCGELLSDQPLFFLINGYAAGYSPLAFAYNLEPLEAKFGGNIEYGDLLIEEESGRFLPCGIFARWKK